MINKNPDQWIWTHDRWNNCFIYLYLFNDASI